MQISTAQIDEHDDLRNNPVRVAIAVRHVSFEDLGGFATVLIRRGYQIKYVDISAGDKLDDLASEADLLIILGGPIGSGDADLYPSLLMERALIEKRLALQRPLLGICLGAQLIAQALGSWSYPASTREIGWFPVTLTETGTNGPLSVLADVPVLHWHGETFDLPVGAEHLASTVVSNVQAFSFGINVLAFQFHPEATEEGFERWLIGHAYEIAATPEVSAPALRAQASEFAAHSAVQGQRCLEAWLDALDFR